MDIERRPFDATGPVGLVERVLLPTGPAAFLGQRLVIIKEGYYARVWKPLTDRVFAALLLFVLMPTLLVIAAVVRCSLGRGVIFKQDRVGRNGRVFTIYKFRTMAHAAPPGPGHAAATPHKSSSDPRHTPVGRVLRKLSLDELPQLWNVVRGDMSLVGPRPEMVQLVEEFDLWNHPRHVVRPGLTGRWQVSPWRARPLHEHLDEDLPYVQRITLLGDLRILVATVAAMVRRSGS
jgi:lipopolysaccharide/colanic/teichoic acid biosynthesis glycosyltransferase